MYVCKLVVVFISVTPSLCVCLVGYLCWVSVLCLSVSVLSSVPSVHGGASSGAVYQSTHQLVCEVQQEEGQGEGGALWGVGQVMRGHCS